MVALKATVSHLHGNIQSLHSQLESVNQQLQKMNDIMNHINIQASTGFSPRLDPRALIEAVSAFPSIFENES